MKQTTLLGHSNLAGHQNSKFVEVVGLPAKEKGATKAQIALAWILSRNDEITAIPGARKIHRLEENLGVFNVALTARDLATIEEHIPHETVGERHY